MSDFESFPEDEFEDFDTQELNMHESVLGGEAAAAPEDEDGYIEEEFDGELNSELEMVPGFDEQLAFEDAPMGESVPVTPALEAIPMAGVEEFGLPESVCGKDSRVKINGTSSIPWRWSAFILMTWPNGKKSRATAWFNGPRTLITSGHCVYSHANGGWAKQITVVPGKNGALQPYGAQIATAFRSVKGWTQSKNSKYDYGAIIMPNNTLGRRVGWFGFAAYGSSTLRNMLVNNAGYAGDKPYGTLWFMAGRITKVESRMLQYFIDTYGGHSGSAVWRLRRGRRYAVGIHGYGGCPNKAVRITRPVFKNLLAWKKLGL